MRDVSVTILIWWSVAASAAVAILTILLGNRKSEVRYLRQQLQSAEGARRNLLTEMQEVKRDLKSAEFKVFGLQKLLDEKTTAFPSLATAIADFHALQGEKDAEFLRKKKHPARKAAEQVTTHSKLRRIAEREARILKYRIEYYEKMFPWLIELVGEDVDTLLEQIWSPEPAAIDQEDQEDSARTYVSAVEYQSLPSVQKYQLALDRYLASRRSKWEVGRDFERYVGFLYEQAGYHVSYQGIVEGVYDLGRDIIARKGGSTQIIQCKRWSTDKLIHEKHIFQLYGSVIEFVIRNNVRPTAKQGELFVIAGPLADIRAVFVTTVKSEECWIIWGGVHWARILM